MFFFNLSFMFKRLQFNCTAIKKDPDAHKDLTFFFIFSKIIHQYIVPCMGKIIIIKVHYTTFSQLLEYTT